MGLVNQPRQKKLKISSVLVTSDAILKLLLIFMADAHFFLKNGPIPASFVYFRSFLVTISLQIEKSIDGVLGIRTRAAGW